MSYLRKMSTSAALPVSVERARERLRIDETENDADLEQLIRSATGVVETETGRTLRLSTFELRLDDWPTCPIAIDVFPVRAIDAVTYVDPAGAVNSVDTEDYYWLDTDAGAELHFVDGFAGPDLRARPQSIRIVISAGYEGPNESGSGDDPALELPAECELAVLFLVGAWCDTSRSALSAGNIVKVPLTFGYIAEQLRIFR